MMASRRGFIGGVAALIAMPAVIRVAPLMKISTTFIDGFMIPEKALFLHGNTLLNVNMITREAVQRFLNSNMFISSISAEYEQQFALTGAQIGSSLRVRLPQDYRVA